MQFLKPIDGDVLFSTADGRADDRGLWTRVTVQAPAGKHIRINGTAATEENGCYTAEILLDAYRNTVEADDGETVIRMVIYWFIKGYKTYRLGVDDVIRVFENIWLHQAEYDSIFDDPYFALFRDLHDQYGTPVHMHLFYETDDGRFNLSMFPDKYKAEFTANGHWLKLTFHSRKEATRFKHMTYEQVMADGLLVEREIKRFAGPAVFSNVTSEHMADSNLYATRGLRNLGYRCFDGYFIFDKNGDPSVSYYLSREQTAHAATRDFWVDNQEDIIFVKDDIVIDQTDLEAIVPHMERISAAGDHCFHYLLIHEQYFYPDYPRYRPDYRERIFTAVDWCHRNGYRPAPLSEFIFERNLQEE